jgi:hypothetical protein
VRQGSAKKTLRLQATKGRCDHERELATGMGSSDWPSHFKPGDFGRFRANIFSCCDAKIVDKTFTTAIGTQMGSSD